MPSEFEYLNISGMEGQALAERLVLDRREHDVFISGTKIRAEYILNLLASGITTEELLRHHPGLNDSDIEACLLASTAKYSIREAENPSLRENCREIRSISEQWITLHPFQSKKPPVEYRLPVPFISEEARNSVDPWLRAFFGKSSQEAREMLEKRWNGIGHDSLKKIKNLIMRNLPRSIIIHDRQGWVLIERGNDEAEGPDQFLVPPPLSRTRIDQFLDRWPFRKKESLQEFFYNFLGLKDILPAYACEFELPIHSLRELFGDDCLQPEFTKEWQIGMPIYSTAGGDILLIHPTGKLGWFYLGTQEIGHEFGDFDGFLEWYIDYKTNKIGPLEAY